MQKFNYIEAKKAGYEDQEIYDYLEQENQKGNQMIIEKADFESFNSTPSQFLDPVEPKSLQPEAQRRKEFITGVGKTGLEYVKGAASLGERLLRGVTKTILPKKAEKALGIEEEEFVTGAEELIPEEAIEAKTGYEKAGKIAGEIASFLAPSAKIAKLEKGMRLIPRAITEATLVGGQEAVLRGDTKDDRVKTATIIGGLFPIAGAALKGTKGLLKPLGEKIQTTVIRPTAKDLKDGFNIKNVNKHKVGGTLEETVTKTHVRLNELSQKLQRKLKDTETVVNLNSVANETADVLAKTRGREFGNIRAIRKVLNDLQAEIKEVAGENGLVDLVEATSVKRGAGTKGAWAFGRIEPDSGAVETVYSTFYNKLKTAIEKAAPEGVGSINKEMSELIPISNAALRRLPVEQRNNVISLTDSIGLFGAMFDPRALALIGANKLSKSGKFGAYLVDIATKQKVRGPVAERVFGGNIDELSDLKGLSIEDVSKQADFRPPAVGKTATKLDDTLIQEAKKYKSAEEFVKAQKFIEAPKLNWDTIPEEGIKAEIPLNKLRVNSEALDKATKNTIKGNGSRTSGDIDVVMLKDGTFVIDEGHHRAVQKVLQKDKNINATIYSSKDIYNGETRYSKKI